jgi:hypothetical protein
MISYVLHVASGAGNHAMVFRLVARGNFRSNAARLKQRERVLKSCGSVILRFFAANRAQSRGRNAPRVGSAVSTLPLHWVAQHMRKPPLASHPQMRVRPLEIARCILAITYRLPIFVFALVTEARVPRSMALLVLLEQQQHHYLRSQRQ